MMKKLYIWLFTILITIASIVYQRKTGPTYPIDGQVEIGGMPLAYTFERAHAGAGDHDVRLGISNDQIVGTLYWRRYKTDDPFNSVPMQNKDGILTAGLPHQPPAGKLEYHVALEFKGERVTFPHHNVVIRFRGDVPAWALIPHILLMFLAMIFSTYTGLSAAIKDEKLYRWIWITCLVLFAGGFIFGPLVQKFAFGDFWTGIPFGTDLTDNKTLVAQMAWIMALIIYRRNPKNRLVVIIAAAITLIVFLIPHSLMGSELDYGQEGMGKV
ncbi:MAG: hypothetical protein EHM72_11005 [Calditrichaeota bacterium]|nr:MAG: hypothetical protein EHM72_11005 [Calditrichota bacterium]